MTEDLEREDRVVGTALSRAIESQAAPETPFVRSRVAARLTAPRRSALVPVLAAAAALAIAFALGSALLASRGEDRAPAATAPGTRPTPGSQTATAIAVTPDRDAIWVYFARDQLPPLGATIRGIFNAATPDSRILSRISELHRLQGQPPVGATNPIALLGVTQGSSGSFGVSVRVDGDLATVEFEADTFARIRGTAMSQALLQQLVYVVTEETGVGRVLIKERGKQNVVIDRLVVDKTLSREDVFGYGFSRPTDRIEAQETAVASTLDSSLAVDTFAPGLSRLRLRLTPTGNAPAGGWTPSFSATMQAKGANDPSAGKWILRVFVEGARDARASTSPPLERVDLSPVRDMRVMAEANGTTYLIGLDDARPWRVSVRPETPVQIFVDIGGHPAAVSESVAVYIPRPGDTTGRDVSIQGSARAFEANVQWRVRDADDKIVASGHATATIGTSAVWGNFTTSATVPPTVTGDVTLEVFWASPQDGRDVGKVSIPLRLR